MRLLWLPFFNAAMIAFEINLPKICCHIFLIFSTKYSKTCQQFFRDFSFGICFSQFFYSLNTLFICNLKLLPLIIYFNAFFIPILWSKNIYWSNYITLTCFKEYIYIYKLIFLILFKLIILDTQLLDSFIWSILHILVFRLQVFFSYIQFLKPILHEIHHLLLIFMQALNSFNTQTRSKRLNSLLICINENLIQTNIIKIFFCFLDIFSFQVYTHQLCNLELTDHIFQNQVIMQIWKIEGD